MAYFFDEKRLQGHPCVYKVTKKKVILKYHFKIQLYKAWKKEQNPAEILRILTENGLTNDLLGPDYCMSLETSFRNVGYPSPYRSEIDSCTDYHEENPLMLSGKYSRPRNGHGCGNGLSIDQSFLQEIRKRFPEVSIEESLRMAGLDPVDVGDIRIRRIYSELTKKQCPESIECSQKPDTVSGEVILQDEKKETEAEHPAEASEAGKTSLLEFHPYVERVNRSGIHMKNAFYNEAYFLYPLGIERILGIFEIPLQEIPDPAKIRIRSKLRNWTQGEEWLEKDSGQIRRIRRTKMLELKGIIKKQFSVLGNGFARMDMGHKKQFCRYLQELPKDTSGYYTHAKIRELTGIPRSTYYALLNDENYGTASEKRRTSDEEDINVIRQVLAYKGFEKGIRQVYMLMPKVTGQSFSINRIRRLMNKYGIRTTIRRPSKNRKAIKELIARNKKANLLMREFRLHRPNEVRLTDVTYLDYGDGQRAYGSASVDPVTGRLVCFIVSENNDLQLALDTLAAMNVHPAKNGAILHSDQGTLYMTDDFQAAVVEKELNQSMSRRGNCWDNAPQESFFGHFKDECHYQKCVTLEELRSMIDGYAVYYNTERGMWEKEHMTPEEYEKYLESMDETQWQEHLAREEERYQKMKEASAAKAVQNAKQYHEEIQERLEEIRS